MGGEEDRGGERGRGKEKWVYIINIETSNKKSVGRKKDNCNRKLPKILLILIILGSSSNCDVRGIGGTYALKL